MWFSSLRLRVLKRVSVLFAISLLGVETIIIAYYWIFDFDRVEFEAEMAAVVAALVGLPMLAYVILQNERLKDLTDKLAYLSSTDQMTGLLNRQTFVERLGMHFYKAGRSSSCGVVAYIDADHFKRLNDLYGHGLGDKVIQLLAQYISAATRQGDLCGRLGGEEFGIFLAGATLEEAGVIAERLRCEVNASEGALGVPDVSISVSIGIAAHKPGETALETLQAADRSLYAAKNEGRNAVVIELKRYQAA